MQIKSFGFVLYILCYSFASNLNAASFNCGGIKNETERAICNNAELNTLDSILGDLWTNDATRTNDLVEDQRAWLTQRESCGSNTECLKQSYLKRLSQDPFYLQSFEIVELYDFQTSEFSEYLAASAYYPYNTLTYIYAMDGRKNPRIEWLKPQFTESLDTCGIRILDDASLQFENSPSELGWINVLNQEYSERSVQLGEVSVYTKWIGHGDMSSEVFYRLVGGQFLADRALIDNCEDQQKMFATIFFNDPLSTANQKQAYASTSELDLQGEFFDNFEALAQQCENSGHNMIAVRGCLMDLTDARMQAAIEARTKFLQEEGSDQAVTHLIETQASFEEYRYSSCVLMQDINVGWIADDLATNCYNYLTRQRTDFLNTQWRAN